jgi:hypothetical protein
MDDHPTCGKGLNQTATLPTAMGELMTAVADVLEAHLPALDLSDSASRKEQEAYRRLIQDHRDTAHRLEALGKQMAGYRDLPMGRHNEAAMAGPGAIDNFRRFVDREQALLAVLEGRLAQDQEMLQAMGAAG